MDSGDNGEVRYELKKGHGELFKVCRKTGEISLKQSLEGHNREYQLTIAAYDSGKTIVKLYSQNNDSKAWVNKLLLQESLLAPSRCRLTLK